MDNDMKWAWFDAGVRHERERILSYLEKVRQETLDDHEELDEYDKGFTDAYANAIDLIK
jgi:hypothetical protein